MRKVLPPACRLCLADNFAEPLTLMGNESLITALEWSLDVQTDLRDPSIYPNHLCHNCNSIIQPFLKLRESSLENEQFLLKFQQEIRRNGFTAARRCELLQFEVVPPHTAMDGSAYDEKEDVEVLSEMEGKHKQFDKENAPSRMKTHTVTEIEKREEKKSLAVNTTSAKFEKMPALPVNEIGLVSGSIEHLNKYSLAIQQCEGLWIMERHNNIALVHKCTLLYHPPTYTYMHTIHSQNIQSCSDCLNPHR